MYDVFHEHKVGCEQIGFRRDEGEAGAHAHSEKRLRGAEYERFDRIVVDGDTRGYEMGGG